MPRLNFHQLRLFLEIARRGTVTDAADAMFVSQPAVSRQVKALERHFGVPLLERDGRGIRLTPLGKRVAEHAAAIFGQALELEREVAQARGLESGRLTLGASTTAGESILLPGLTRFRAVHPGIEIELVIANSREITRRVEARELDIGFVGGPSAAGRLERIPFHDDVIVATISPAHELAAAADAPLASVLAHPTIARERGSGTRAAVETHLGGLGVPFRPAFELGSNQAVKQAAMAALGVAFLARSAIAQEATSGDLLELDTPELRIPHSFAIIHRRSRRLTPAERAFLRLVRDGRRRAARSRQAGS